MLGRLLDRLDAAHALDRTLVIVTADHGESLGEHGEIDARPVRLRGDAGGAADPERARGRPRAVSTRRSATRTSCRPSSISSGLAPPAESRRTVARGMPPLPTGPGFEALEANLTRGWAPLTGVVSGDWKYIDLPLPELYDLPRIRVKNANLVARDPARRETLSRALSQLGRHRPRHRRRRSWTRSPRRGCGRSVTRRRRPECNGATADSDDPKRLVALNEQFNGGAGGVQRRTPRSGAVGLPRADAATAGLHHRADQRGDRAGDESGGRLTQWPCFAPHRRHRRGSPEILAKLGTALRETGDLRGAAAAFERSRAAGNQNPELLNDLGVVYAQAGTAGRGARAVSRAAARAIRTRQASGPTSAFSSCRRGEPERGGRCVSPCRSVPIRPMPMPGKGSAPPR